MTPIKIQPESIKVNTVRQRLSELHQLPSVEEREEHLFDLASDCGNPQDIICFRDYDNGVDVFLVEFDNAVEAQRANLLMGFSQIAKSNIASLIIPSNYLH